MTDEVLLTVDARGIATITLNRPRVNNAYDGAMIAGLLEAGAAIAADAAVRVVVVRGNGRHFQAGADLQWLRGVAAGDAAANDRASADTAEALRRLNECGKPTVALVQGACIGGGTGLVGSCDIVIAEQTASFAIAEARWGLTATIIFPQLVAAIGLRQLRRYALSGETFDAARARAMGLVHEVCAPGALDTTAAPIIDGLMRSAPEAIAQTKRGALRCAGASVDDDTLRLLVAMHSARRQSDEAREGLASFAEGRSPVWRG